jgi:phospholipase C
MKMMGATAAGGAGLNMLPPAIQKALAIEPNSATGTIKDVKHVVILMQENRSFDHYFGTYNGVRGYTDPRPVRWQAGREMLPIWFQPNDFIGTNRLLHTILPELQCGTDPDTGTVAPFYIDYAKTGEVVRFTCHLVESGIKAWNNGSYNRWLEAKLDVLVMGYLKHQDVSYHRNLANAFTICDQYFSSVHGDTSPNRMHLWSGTASNPAIAGTGAYMKGFAPLNMGPEPGEGCTWTSYPERIEDYNAKQADKTRRISWRVYQGGTGADDSTGKYTDNFGDNSLEYFAAYRNDPVKGAYWKEGKCHIPQVWPWDPPIKTDVNYDELKPLTRNGVTNRTLRQFKKDVDQGKLPNISWIVPPEHYSEHTHHNSATDGAYYINEVLSALVDNPDVWSKTVLIINYDENDGYFDHIVPPMPPLTEEDGKVSPSLASSITRETNRDFLVGKDHPIGFGPRVPCLVISPWTKGGWVCSQVFDHTSVLQFLEARFGIRETNISDWRRAVAGDLTSAFDFKNPDSAKVALPSDFKIRGPKSGKPAQPKVQSDYKTNLPKAENPRNVFAFQTSNENGTRKARAIPYDFSVKSSVDMKKRQLNLEFINEGPAGVCLYVYDETGNYMGAQPEPRNAPTRYTLVKDEPLKAAFNICTLGYRFSVYGPNGYLCQFQGRCDPTIDDKINISLEKPTDGYVQLKIDTTGSWKDNFLKLTSLYSPLVGANGKLTNFIMVPLPQTESAMSKTIDIATLHGWYDLMAEFTDKYGGSDPFNTQFMRRYAGHVENGLPSRTDPLLTAFGMMEEEAKTTIVALP